MTTTHIDAICRLPRRREGIPPLMPLLPVASFEKSGTGCCLPACLPAALRARFSSSWPAQRIYWPDDDHKTPPVWPLWRWLAKLPFGGSGNKKEKRLPPARARASRRVASHEDHDHDRAAFTSWRRRPIISLFSR